MNFKGDESKSKYIYGYIFKITEFTLFVSFVGRIALRQW